MTHHTATVSESFQQRYGTRPRWIAAAPGRVNVIGEHTDYNDGFVLPMAIERYTYFAAAPIHSNLITIRTDAAAQAPFVIDLTQPLRPASRGQWSNYPLGVIAGFLSSGFKLPGFNALIHSTVPLGAGVSSSAALLVATATALEAMLGQRLDPMRKTLLCQKAEHEFAGVPSGIMDPCISILGREGHLLLLDCRSHATQWVPVDDPAVRVLVVNTNVKHDLATSEYSVRRSQCETAARALSAKSLREVVPEQLNSAKGALDETVFRRARHVISEIDRTVRAAERLRDHQWTDAGQLMYASHESLRTDYEVSCPELDTVVNIAQNIGVQGGVFGCRMTGGGFGGCAVALIATDAQDAIVQTITTEYLSRTGIMPTLFVSRPAAGAHVITSP